MADSTHGWSEDWDLREDRLRLELDRLDLRGGAEMGLHGNIIGMEIDGDIVICVYIYSYIYLYSYNN